MDDIDTVRTGDALLFSSNTPTGFLLKTFVSSVWNHSGVAIRLKLVYKKGKPVWNISMDHTGELYVLETNTGTRHDDVYGGPVVGVGLSKADWVISKYNRVCVRRLLNIFRTPELGKNTMKFIDKYRGTKFPGSSLPFLGAWIGVPLKQTDDTDMFCSEIMAYYYSECIGGIYKDVVGMDYDCNLTSLFGQNAPNTHDMYTPGHYSVFLTPEACIFENTDDVIRVQHSDILYSIIQPLVLVLFILLIIWMILP